MIKKSTISLIILMFSAVVLSSQINIEKIRHEKEKRGFEFTLGLDLTIDKGNTDDLEIIPSFQLDYFQENYYTFIYFKWKYEESDNSKIANKAKIHYRYIYYLSDLLSPEFFLQTEYDEFIAQKERDLAGVGIRFNLLDPDSKSDSLSCFGLRLGIGAMFEYEHIESTPDYFHRNTRMASYLSFIWEFSKEIAFVSTTYFQPKLNNFDNIKIFSESKLQFNLTKYLAIVLNFSLNYYSKPPEDIKTYDIEISNGLRLNL